jgi:hypothetical protein
VLTFGRTSSRLLTKFVTGTGVSYLNLAAGSKTVRWIQRHVHLSFFETHHVAN